MGAPYGKRRAGAARGPEGVLLLGGNSLQVWLPLGHWQGEGFEGPLAIVAVVDRKSRASDSVAPCQVKA